MNQDAAVIGAVPMNSPGRAPDDIAHGQLLWDPALVADPAGTGLDFEDLAVLVMVPMRPGTGGKCRRDHSDALFLLVEDTVVPDFTGEGRALLLGLAVFGPGGPDDCHRHLGGLGELWDMIVCYRA